MEQSAGHEGNCAWDHKGAEDQPSGCLLVSLPVSLCDAHHYAEQPHKGYGHEDVDEARPAMVEMHDEHGRDGCDGEQDRCRNAQNAMRASSSW